MSFPKTGRFFPDEELPRNPTDSHRGANSFATEISLALEKGSNQRRIYIKTVASWTGANERTVKNWISGECGPSGDHLMILARHSDDVLSAVLSMIGRDDLLVGVKVADIERRLVDLVSLLRSLGRSK